MKKYAMMLMNPLFIPEQHTVLFQTGNIENHIITVRNEMEALEKVKELIEEKFGVLEVCGAFSQELIEKIKNMSENKMCIGHVIYDDDQEERLEKYWSSEEDE